MPDARDILVDLTQRDVLAMVAEFEADLIRLRTKEGMRVAGAKRRLRGTQPKLNPRQEAHLVMLYRAGEHTVSELGDLFGITRSTVYRAVQRDTRRQSTGAGMRADARAPVRPILHRDDERRRRASVDEPPVVAGAAIAPYREDR